MKSACGAIVTQIQSLKARMASVHARHQDNRMSLMSRMSHYSQNDGNACIQLYALRHNL